MLAKNSPLSPKEWDNIREKFLADVAINRLLPDAHFPMTGAMPKPGKSHSVHAPKTNGTRFLSAFG